MLARSSPLAEGEGLLYWPRRCVVNESPSRNAGEKGFKVLLRCRTIFYWKTQRIVNAPKVDAVRRLTARGTRSYPQDCVDWPPMRPFNSLAPGSDAAEVCAASKKGRPRGADPQTHLAAIRPSPA